MRTRHPLAMRSRSQGTKYVREAPASNGGGGGHGVEGAPDRYRKERRSRTRHLMAMEGAGEVRALRTWDLNGLARQGTGTGSYWQLRDSGSGTEQRVHLVHTQRQSIDELERRLDGAERGESLLPPRWSSGCRPPRHRCRHCRSPGTSSALRTALIRPASAGIQQTRVSGEEQMGTAMRV
ncbi:hypothetical protein P7K49_016289 [Saguinus oedipus]|uniref:Uncharacterized protein n=1 Tax=Saguinus oedipus TaxID=9490 RepID=A0ABQ9VBP5_SAGOE|nr:hypothetical protein P7K49_016289 [Saguinus oedipus]